MLRGERSLHVLYIVQCKAIIMIEEQHVSKRFVKQWSNTHSQSPFILWLTLKLILTLILTIILISTVTVTHSDTHYHLY